MIDKSRTYSNDIIEDDFILSNETFLDVEMPNVNGFIIDDLLTSESHFWNKKVCMSNCKSEVKITMRAAVLDVTPEDEETNTNQVALKSEKISEPNQVNVKLEAEVAALDAELLKSGEKAFKKCQPIWQELSKQHTQKTPAKMFSNRGIVVDDIDVASYKG